MSSLSMGCKGLLSGSGSVIADLQAQLFRAVQANDLAAAKAINDRIYPLAQVFYAQPWVDMHNRMKEALVLMGKLPRAVVRPPLVKIERAEIERIRRRWSRLSFCRRRAPRRRSARADRSGPAVSLYSSALMESWLRRREIARRRFCQARICLRYSNFSPGRNGALGILRF